MKILIVGYGSIADELVKSDSTNQFYGIKRSIDRNRPNLELYEGNYTNGIDAKILQLQPDIVLFFPKTLGTSPDEYKKAYLEPLEFFQKNFKNALKVFISSTRVFKGYANVNVDERTEPIPIDEQGHIIYQYEKIALSLNNSYLLRLGGLISKNKNYVRDILDNKSIKHNKYINAIHICDVASAISRVLSGQTNEKILNLVMPIKIQFSDLDTQKEGTPLNAHIQSIHYNEAYYFKYPNITDLL
tara:strand:- start:104 stop:835 length:732 start_codon:yes stop_codon:yes gene_type:complete